MEILAEADSAEAVAEASFRPLITGLDKCHSSIVALTFKGVDWRQPGVAVVVKLVVHHFQAHVPRSLCPLSSVHWLQRDRSTAWMETRVSSPARAVCE